MVQANSGTLMMKEIGFQNPVLDAKVQGIFQKLGTKITKIAKIINC